MKKVILVLLTLFIGAALADSAPTSVGYVDSQIGALQNKISAVDTNTVLTHTNTAGEIGQKSIYDATGNYVEQQNALVTAEVANAAVQNAIDGEFVCTEWLDGAEHTNENCLIYEIRAAKLALMPTGYTPLEYIESTGTQYIDTGISPDINTRVDYKLQFTEKLTGGQPLIGARVGSTAVARFLVFSNAFLADQGRTVFGGNREVAFSASINTDFIGSFRPSEGKSIINGTEYDISNSSFVKTNDNNIYIFATSGYTESLYKSKGKIYFVDIYQNGSIVRNMIPARRNSDDEIGMYDLVSNTFFTNSGTGKFIAGPELNIYLPSGN